MDRILAQTIHVSACADAYLQGLKTDPLHPDSPLAGTSGVRFEYKAGKKTLDRGDSLQAWFASLRDRGAETVHADLHWIDRGSHLDEADEPVFKGEWQWAILVRHKQNLSREAWRVGWEDGGCAPRLALFGRMLSVHHEGAGLEPVLSLKAARRRLDKAYRTCESLATTLDQPEWATVFKTGRSVDGRSDDGLVPRAVLPAGKRWDASWRLLGSALQGDAFWQWSTFAGDARQADVQDACVLGRKATMAAVVAATVVPRRWSLRSR